ncbi:MAG: ABC transporter permease [Candidatus Saccharibacteria bacterium]
MKLSRTMALTSSNLKRTFREPSFLFLVIMFPIALTILFGTAFGAVGGGDTIYKMGVVDLDHSADHQWSDALSANMTATKILQTSSYTDLTSAQKDLSEGKLQGVLVIPEGFNDACAAYATNSQDPAKWTAVQVQLYLDPGSMISVQAIPSIVQNVVTITVYGPSAQLNGPITLGTAQVATSAHLTAFDYMAPGVITFAAVFLTMIVGQSFALDREKGLLRRMNATPMRASEFVLSNVLSNMVIAVLQLGLVAALIMALGFHSAATASGIGIAFVLVILFSVCSVGFGLITAAVAKTPSQATMIAFVFIMPQMFLGTFMGASLSGAAQSIGAVLPAYYVTDGLNSILLRGITISSGAIMLDLAIVAGFAVASLVAGIVLFQRYGNR